MRIQVVWRPALVGVAAGVVIGGLMMSIAWDHNPQGEFHGASGVQWRTWLSLGLSWFAVVAAPGVVISLAVRLLRTR